MPTFAQLIKECAWLTGAAIHEGIATAGSTTTLTDTVELGGYADDTFNDKRLYIYEGTALGQERRITDHAGATSVLTFPAGTAPTTSSKYIILDQGWTIGQIRSALINALRIRRKQLLEPMVDETVTLAADVFEYTVPSGFATIYKIVRESQPASGVFNYLLSYDWWILEQGSTKKIVFEEAAEARELFLVDSCALQIHGQKYEDEPDTDDDVISVQTGSVMLIGAVLALLSRVAADPTNSRRHTAQASMLLGEFQRTAQMDVSAIWPGSRFVNE